MPTRNHSRPTSRAVREVPRRSSIPPLPACSPVTRRPSSSRCSRRCRRCPPREPQDAASSMAVQREAPPSRGPLGPRWTLRTSVARSRSFVARAATRLRNLQVFLAMARPGLEPGTPRFSGSRGTKIVPAKVLQIRGFRVAARRCDAAGSGWFDARLGLHRGVEVPNEARPSVPRRARPDGPRGRSSAGQHVHRHAHNHQPDRRHGSRMRSDHQRNRPNHHAVGDVSPRCRPVRQVRRGDR
jgi:hypothetical protein